MAKIIAVNTSTAYDYVLKSQRADEPSERITWKLKHLSAKEDALIEDKLGHVRDGDYHINLGSQSKLALDIGLVSVSNFFTEDGEAVEVARTNKKLHGFVKELEPSFIDRIPKEVRTELATAILAGSKLSEEDLKN